MTNTFLRRSTPFTQLFFALLIVFLGGMIISVVGLLLSMLFFGIGFSETALLMNDLSNPRNISILKFFQVMQSLGMFLLPPFLIAWYLSDRPLDYLGLNRKPAIKIAITVFVIVLVSNPLMEWITNVNVNIKLPYWLDSVERWMWASENQANKITKAFLATDNFGGLLSNLFLVAVLPAIGEELLFRGILQKLIRSLTGNAHAAIWITAFIFSALHLQFFGFFPRFLIGALLGYLMEWTGSLWIPILAHFINNAGGVILYYITGKGIDPENTDAPLFQFPEFLSVIVSVLLVWLLLRYIYSQCTPLPEKPSSPEIFGSE